MTTVPLYSQHHISESSTYNPLPLPSMASYVVTGVSRGLGYEFLRQLSANPANTVIGLSRNKASTQEKVTRDALKNVTILEADISDSSSLQVGSKAASGVPLNTAANEP